MCCLFFFFCNDTATTEIYTLSLHDALPILRGLRLAEHGRAVDDRAVPRGQEIRGLEKHGGPLLEPPRGPVAPGLPRRRDGRLQLSGARLMRLGEHVRSEEHTSELQSHSDLVCRLLLET